MQPHIGIVGAGIGGHTAALGLLRAGPRVTVVGQAPVRAEGGADGPLVFPSSPTSSAG